MIIWLASYPRSGSTFFRTILKSCFGYDTYSVYNDADISRNDRLAALTGHTNLEANLFDDGFDLSGFRAGPEPVFIKTHEASPRLAEPEDRVIYIMRDGREASVSFQHYQKNINNHHVSFESIMLGLSFPWCSWGEHARHWLQASRPHGALNVQFETMISEPEQTISAVAAYTGLTPCSTEVPGFSSLQKVDSQFFRKGAKDSFKDTLTRQEQLLFSLVNYPVMQRYGYDAHHPVAELEGLDAQLITFIGDTLLAVAMDLRKTFKAMESAAISPGQASSETGTAFQHPLAAELVTRLQELGDRQAAIAARFPDILTSGRPE